MLKLLFVRIISNSIFMSIKRIDYKEAREYYIKGEGDEYPSLYDVAREFKYSLSTLRKKAANEGWLKKRKERISLQETMEMRKEFNYPPYQNLIRHLFRSRSEAKVEFYSNKWADLINESKIKHLTIKGPAPAPIEKIKGFYRFHLFYFTKSVRMALKDLSKIRESFPLDPEVHDILDVDAHQIS